MSGQSSAADAARLAALRARLYAPDTSEVDREDYEMFLAQTMDTSSVDRSAEDPRSVATTLSSANGAPDRGRQNPARLIVALVLALVVGGAAGAALSSRAGSAPVSASTTSAPSPSESPPLVPTPIAAAPLLRTIDQQNASATALVKALAIKNSDARSIAVSMIDSDDDSHSDLAWSHSIGCSEYTGSGNVSIDGRPSGLYTSAGETSTRPTGTRFRLTIRLTRAANWSWIAYGTRTGSDTGLVALGAGSSSSGPAQYADFTAKSSTVVTTIKISTSSKTPFIWQLDSCTPE